MAFIRKIKSRVADCGYELVVSAQTKKKIIEQGFDPKFGARPLRKAILEIVEDPVSEQLIRLRGRKSASLQDNKIVL